MTSTFPWKGLRCKGPMGYIQRKYLHGLDKFRSFNLEPQESGFEWFEKTSETPFVRSEARVTKSDCSTSSEKAV